jgi:tRNA pseudouridine55 synthase
MPEAPDQHDPGHGRGGGAGAGPARPGHPKVPRPSTTGILVVDKPVGPTSMRVVAIVRRRAGGVRTGHAGTLDPLASGVLVLALGKATKLIERLMATDKCYLTGIDLSAFTATDDLEAEREVVPIVRPPTEEEVRAALDAFRGTFRQRPPTFSAVKIGGRAAYAHARRGKEVAPAPRPVTVHELDLVRYEWPFVDLSIRCGKGFYVRSLARALGEALGTGGHCASIRRTAVGPFTIDRAVPLDDVPDPLEQRHLMDADVAMGMVGGSD